MEGYFVRTLGMHRVYNSAFMNMLRDEDNAKYRLVIKNTLEFDPEILKRYVNFMNNPDERTAVDQFGKGDKYFGICTMMATLPGLPMFGHGQIEGFTEKYGMEYRRAYWDEQPDRVPGRSATSAKSLRSCTAATSLPTWSIFCCTISLPPDGRCQRGCICLFEPRRATSARWWSITTNLPRRAAGSAPRWTFSVKAGPGDLRRLVRKTLGRGPGAAGWRRPFCIFRDHITGLEYIRSSKELCERGLYVELDAYKCHVFLDWREVLDDEGHPYAYLTSYLNGRGVPDIEEALRELFLQPVHEPFRELVNANRPPPADGQSRDRLLCGGSQR